MGDFVDWYHQRHGYPPFPWQAAFAARIADGDWPDALTPPTGSGKTGVIDAWLWARLQGHPVPRRLVYVIDRRLVVDGVGHYAHALCNSLPEADRPGLIQMRGGITIDNDWVTEPDRPTILISTVDQAGSRLLFSGYGVAPRAASIHAAMLGNDALWVLDEVHLAQPLLKTLSACRDLGAQIRVLPMSATWESENTHGLGGDDLTHPVLARRLANPKPAKLVKLRGNDDLVAALAKAAESLREEGAGLVGVVCNRVATARGVFEHLQAADDAVLLTGRIRPADRDALLGEYLPRMTTGSRAAGRDPLYVVATQTIEVGADLDLDALVTEHAPLSALRQRAGRLNRLGELVSAPMTVVYQPRKDDPIYGDLKPSWDWLGKGATGKGKNRHVDFGISALNTTTAGSPPPAESTPTAPQLLRSQLDLLASNVPHGIDIAPWLHGWQRGSPDVYLCWRADCGSESVTAAPPQQHELLAVPWWAARQWSGDLADIEDGSAGEARERRLECLRWDGERAEHIDLRRTRIGDTLVLPVAAGGCDRYGWAPESIAAVSDVGDSDRRVRLHPAVHPELAEDIAVLLDSEPSPNAWRRLAGRAGLPDPGRVVAIANGVVVLARSQWTSASAYRPVLLRDHAPGVGAEAVRFARGLGFTDPELLDTLRLAGSGHDAGKADPRWQAWVGGDGVEPLAKGPGGDDLWLTLPRGWRHEMGSVARLAAAAPLVRYLVGTHHGHGRPLFPAAPEPELWRQMGDWAGLRAELVREHGYWGLALLEALVRLADWRVSSAEQEDATDEADRAAA